MWHQATCGLKDFCLHVMQDRIGDVITSYHAVLRSKRAVTGLFARPNFSTFQLGRTWAFRGTTLASGEAVAVGAYETDELRWIAKNCKSRSVAMLLHMLKPLQVKVQWRIMQADIVEYGVTVVHIVHFLYLWNFLILPYRVMCVWCRFMAVGSRTASYIQCVQHA